MYWQSRHKRSERVSKRKPTESRTTSRRTLAARGPRIKNYRAKLEFLSRRRPNFNRTYSASRGELESLNYQSAKTQNEFKQLKLIRLFILLYLFQRLIKLSGLNRSENFCLVFQFADQFVYVGYQNTSLSLGWSIDLLDYDPWSDVNAKLLKGHSVYSLLLGLEDALDVCKPRGVQSQVTSKHCW